MAPHAVIIDHRTRSGSLTLYNPGDEPAEIALSAFFGYPVTDSTGGFELRTVEQPEPDYPSAAKWVDAFPKRMLLGPKQRQTVRLLARPPAGLPDGEYWARLVISAKGGTVPVSGVADSSGVQVALALEIRTVIPLQYRKGRVATGREDLRPRRRRRAGFPGGAAATRPHRQRGLSRHAARRAGGFERARSWPRSAARWRCTTTWSRGSPRRSPLAGLPAGRYRLKSGRRGAAGGSRRPSWCWPRPRPAIRSRSVCREPRASGSGIRHRGAAGLPAGSRPRPWPTRPQPLALPMPSSWSSPWAGTSRARCRPSAPATTRSSRSPSSPIWPRLRRRPLPGGGLELILQPGRTASRSSRVAPEIRSGGATVNLTRRGPGRSGAATST